MSLKAPLLLSLDQLLHYDACKFTSAELQLNKSLPQWILKSHSSKLKTILSSYLRYVSDQLRKMEQFLEEENISIFNMHVCNRVMEVEAFIDETNEKLDNCEDPEVRDACLITCVQEINHYKLSAYGSAAEFARVLAMPKHATIFYAC